MAQHSKTQMYGTTVEDVIKIVPNFKESKQQSDECSENGILSEEYASAEEEDQEPQLVQEPLQSSSQQEDQEHSDVPEQKQLESVRDCSGRPRILRSGKTYNALNALETKELILPQTFREATQGEANSYWKEAMAKEAIPPVAYGKQPAAKKTAREVQVQGATCGQRKRSGQSPLRKTTRSG
ncbi:hypothetical protein ACLKA6_016411 [Drosophila palustris]